MIRRDTARRLCTAREYELVEASFPENIRQLTPSALRQKVDRARKLRDKNRDLLKRQRLEVRGKRAPRRVRPAQGTANTEKKADIFDEVMQRFQDALKQPAKKTAAKKTAAKKTSAKKTSAKKTTAKKTTAKKTTAKKTTAKKTTAKKTTAKKTTAKKTSQTNPRQRSDAGTKALGRTLRARGRAATQRGQNRRDNRGR
jgi:hypothetical protein